MRSTCVLCACALHVSKHGHNSKPKHGKRAGCECLAPKRGLAYCCRKIQGVQSKTRLAVECCAAACVKREGCTLRWHLP
ncbi:hypothetical protein GQ54DRAFT_1064 [Martensiomyces pterosporus]|nr:hypothetical protein GQ54DRAFT_1064 [Martensiomyces pterosporus]